MRSRIDAWPIASSGLASRPVTCLTRAGIETVGELRRWPDEKLLALSAFGVLSLRNIHWFFDWTRRLETGNELLPDLRAWLDEFLTPRQRDVIEQRFGLTDPLFRPWMKRTTLREIGGERRGGISRERVRQIEDAALGRLQTELARALVAPLRLQLADAKLAAPILGGYESWGATVLLKTVAVA